MFSFDFFFVCHACSMRLGATTGRGSCKTLTWGHPAFKQDETRVLLQPFANRTDDEPARRQPFAALALEDGPPLAHLCVGPLAPDRDPKLNGREHIFAQSVPIMRRSCLEQGGEDERRTEPMNASIKS